MKQHICGAILVLFLFLHSAVSQTAPQISTATPISGYPGTQVTVTGAGFNPTQGSGGLWLGNTWAAILSWSDTQIVATSNATASGDLKVAQNGLWSNAVSFTVPPPASISSATPTSGYPGTQVTVTGTGFNATQGSGNVWLGNTWATIISWSDTQIVARSNATASGDLKVAQNGLWSNALSFTVLPPPSVGGATPTSGFPGTQVTVTGTGFGASQGSGSLWLGNTWATIVSWSDTQIVATSNATASGDLKVAQNGLWSNALNFTVPPPPSISGASPTTGYPGTQVTVAGTGFNATRGSGNLWLGNTWATILSWSDSQIVATSNATASGDLKVAQSGLWSNALSFTVPPPASLNSVTPTTGYPGTQVTVVGTGFGASQGTGNLWIGNTWATVASWSDTQIVATSNATASGDLKVAQNGLWSNALPSLSRHRHRSAAPAQPAGFQAPRSR